MKNIFILGLLTVVTLSYASEPIEKESMEADEKFRVEKAVKENKAGRAFAGAKAKAKKESGGEIESEAASRTEDREVQYWEYQE
jgi:hypothetical protein